jgi:hypothetical protein
MFGDWFAFAYVDRLARLTLDTKELVMKKSLFVFLLIGCSFFSIALLVGSLDTSFGAGGKVDSSFSPVIEEVKAAVLQEDGEIVIADFAQFAATGKNFMVARYLTDGTLDNSCGDNGIVFTEFISGNQDEVEVATDVNFTNVITTGQVTKLGINELSNISNTDVWYDYHMFRYGSTYQLSIQYKI